MMSTSFYSQEELFSLGFRTVGKGCNVSRKASLYSISNISLGDNVRIDDFCIISGNVTLGDNVHISAFVALYGGESGIVLMDNSGVSSRSTIYAEIDDFTGSQLIGPTHPADCRCIIRGRVILHSFSQIGAHCVVMPGVVINEGAVVGACSFVNSNLTPWSIYFGVPAVFHRIREQR